MVSIKLSVTSLVQGEIAYAVILKLTVPAVISFEPGVYIAVNEVLSLKVPSPEVVHRTDCWSVAVAAKV